MLSTRMLRAKSLALLLALTVVGLGLAPPSWSVAPDTVAVHYQLTPEFAGTQKTGGRIVVQLINRSPHALSKVTVRLADSSVGRLTGPVQETLALAAGETRQLEGEFVLDTDFVKSGRTLEWIVIATEPEGFARQTLVQGQLLHDGSMDADSRTASH